MKNITLVLGAAIAAATSSQLQAMPSEPVSDASPVVQVANGCGPGRYRGPGGACHWYGRGPYPGGYYGPYRRPYRGTGARKRLRLRVVSRSRRRLSSAWARALSRRLLRRLSILIDLSRKGGRPSSQKRCGKRRRSGAFVRWPSRLRSAV